MRIHKSPESKQDTENEREMDKEVTIVPSRSWGVLYFGTATLCCAAISTHPLLERQPLPTLQCKRESGYHASVTAVHTARTLRQDSRPGKLGCKAFAMLHQGSELTLFMVSVGWHTSFHPQSMPSFVQRRQCNRRR
jgi:hypothetical protein